jgi:hypothetical protein
MILKKSIMILKKRNSFFFSSVSDKNNNQEYSETIRETTFQFGLFKKNLPKHKKKINSAFLEWFIGFSEGDGSFIVSHPKTEVTRLFFTLVQEDAKILNKIRSTLGFGSVQSHGKHFRYSVTDAEGIDRLIHLFNGNLVLKKSRERFHLWLQARKEIRLSPTARIRAEKIEERKTILDIDFLSCGWLSGFTDAEGCFTFTKTLNKTPDSFGVRCRFVLVQKGEYKVLKKIEECIGSGSIQYYESSTVSRYFLTNLEYLDILMKYLKNFPLKTKKNFCKVRMEKMMEYKRTKKQVPWEGKVLKRVLKLIQENKKS